MPESYKQTNPDVQENTQTQGYRLKKIEIWESKESRKQAPFMVEVTLVTDSGDTKTYTYTLMDNGTYTPSHQTNNGDFDFSNPDRANLFKYRGNFKIAPEAEFVIHQWDNTRRIHTDAQPISQEEAFALQSRKTAQEAITSALETIKKIEEEKVDLDAKLKGLPDSIREYVTSYRDRLIEAKNMILGLRDDSTLKTADNVYDYHALGAENLGTIIKALQPEYLHDAYTEMATAIHLYNTLERRDHSSAVRLSHIINARLTGPASVEAVCALLPPSDVFWTAQVLAIKKDLDSAIDVLQRTSPDAAEHLRKFSASLNNASETRMLIGEAEVQSDVVALRATELFDGTKSPAEIAKALGAMYEKNHTHKNTESPIRAAFRGNPEQKERPR